MVFAITIALVAFLGILYSYQIRQGSPVGERGMRAIDADIAVVLQRVRAGDRTQDATAYLSSAKFECHDVTDVLDPDPDRIGRVIVCRKRYRKLLSLFPEELVIQIKTSEDGASVSEVNHNEFKLHL